MLSRLIFLAILLLSSPAWAVCNQYSTTYEAKSTAIPDVPRNTILRSPDFCTKFVRITDGTDGEGASIADVQFPVFSHDNTRMLFQITGGTNTGGANTAWNIYTFNPTTMASSQLGIPSSAGGCYISYAQWDQSGDPTKNKYLYCMTTGSTDATRHILQIDTTTSAFTETDLISSATILAKLNITGTVTSSASSTCVNTSFTDFDDVADNYVGMSLTVGANSAQIITSYTLANQKLCVGSALSGVSNGTAITISATGQSGRLFAVSPNGETMCWSVNDGTTGRGSSGGRYMLAYRFSDASLKVHRVSHAEMVGTSTPFANHLLGGMHAGVLSKDGTKCIFSMDGQPNNGAINWWEPWTANPNPNTGDGKIYGPNIYALYSHPATGPNQLYTIDGDTAKWYEYQSYANLPGALANSPIKIFTMPTKGGHFWPHGQDQYNTAQHRADDGSVIMVNQHGTAQACGAGQWTSVSGSIYTTTVAWPAGFSFPCDSLLELTSANNSRLYGNGKLLPQVGTDTSTAATCPGLMSVGTWCWASDSSKPYVWLVSNGDLTQANTTDVLTIASSTNTTACFTSGSAVDNYYNGRLMDMTISTGGTAGTYGAIRPITAYVGATKCATFSPGILAAGVPVVSGIVAIFANSVEAFDQRTYTQCFTQFWHNRDTDVAFTRNIDCPPAEVQVPNDTGIWGFFNQQIASISNDGCFLAARLPWSQTRTDVFVYDVCESRPALSNIKSVNNSPAASNFKAATVSGDQRY